MSDVVMEFIREAERAIDEIRGIESSLAEEPGSLGQLRLLELQVARLEAECNYLVSRSEARAA